MVKREDLKQVDTAILQKKYRVFRIAFFVLIAIVLFMSVIGFLNWKTHGLNATALLPVFFIPMVIVNYLSFKRIKEELSARKLTK
jgi:uncharacterized membrane protein YadS